MKFKLTLSTIMQIELHLYHYTPVSNIIINTDSMPLLISYATTHAFQAKYMYGTSKYISV